MFVDLYVLDIPWDIVTDHSGKVVGEVYKPLPDPPPRKKQNKIAVLSTSVQGKR
ncbi:hypothetical protein [Paenibacillus illinoisensis]|uniref:hypothetical protein n=1 Tax=Paenibacillus illinoisensis TaxID=59845 RepID=UPI0013E3634C|nr:hypothetical protein [Paenibacillus illinoisensis]